MAEESNKIDQLFKDSLGNFEENPPIDIWDGINEDLDKLDKKRSLVIFYRIAASIAIILAIGSVYLLLNNRSVEIAQNPKVDTYDIKSENEKAIQVPYTEKISNKDDIIKNTSTLNNEQTIDNEYNNIVSQVDENNEINEFVVVQIGRKDDLISEILPIQTQMLAVYDEDIHLSDYYFESKIQEMIYAFNEVDNADDKNIEWALGGQFSPVISGRDIRQSETLDKENYGKLNSEDFNEENLLAFAGGINVNLITDDRFSIQSGVYYSQMGQQINNVSVLLQEEGYRDASTMNYLNVGQFNTSSGQLETLPSEYFYGTDDNIINIPVENDGWNSGILDAETAYVNNRNNSAIIEKRITNSITNYSQEEIDYSYISENISRDQLNPSNGLINSIEYVEVPIIMKYKLVEKKLDINILGGISTNFLVKNRVYFVDYDGEKNTIPFPKNEDYRNVNYSSILGIGIEYPLLENFSLNFEPSFKYYLNSMNKNDAYSSYPYSLTFFSGISYKF